MNNIFKGFLVAIALMMSSFAAKAQEAGGTLAFLVQPEPPTLASYVSTSGPIGLVMPKVYEGLFDYDNDGKMVPMLAESYEMSADGKTVTFKLRKNVRWHDGKPFTSADVKFTILEVLKKVHPRGPNSFREVSRIDTPDDHTAIFHLDNPAPYMMRSFSAYESPMVPMHLLEGQDVKSASLANNPVGTGPFKFVEWKKGQYIRLDKNEDYWQEGLPYLDRIVGRFIPDASTRTAAMENGEVMYAAYNAIPNIDAVRLKERDDIGVTTDGYSMINPMALIEFNTIEGPFVDPAIRRAISTAIDRRFMIDTIFFGYGKPATSALSSNFKATNLHAAMPNYPETGDVAAANAMLDAAGYAKDANGVRMRAVLDIIPYGEDWRRAGEYLKQVMGDIGIEVELRYEDVPTWLKRVYHNYDFEMNINYFYQLPDPVLGVHRHYGTNQIRQGTHFVNSSRYSNPELDALLDSGSKEPDAAKRTATYKEVQEILAQDMPVVNLFELEFLTVYNTQLKGAYGSAMGAYGSFREAWLDD
ncbi:MAG: ABC transporter substrate-binding protein [Proteobacteria bacterium]|jgi:peptide/nickel transport system substrate-binding protein|nr:ABC transporter substrate-binding protein [Pseudomonadota bacterium]MDA0909391.1 ABC transporter substrate-binding protein [Pseudomonadota bacterium]MDA1320214.1 ABC transporter substrate-binding protein [Pseudomonadota bacterium]